MRKYIEQRLKRRAPAGSKVTPIDALREEMAMPLSTFMSELESLEKEGRLRKGEVSRDLAASTYTQTLRLLGRTQCASAMYVQVGLIRSSLNNLMDGHTVQYTLPESAPQEDHDGASCLPLQAVLTADKMDECLLNLVLGHEQSAQVREIVFPTFGALLPSDTLRFSSYFLCRKLILKGLSAATSMTILTSASLMFAG